MSDIKPLRTRVIFNKGKGQHAFSLVELLVVIAILAILMTLLLPALKSSQFMANNIQCAKKLKSLYLIWALYADDNQDLLPDFNDRRAVWYVARSGWSPEAGLPGLMEPYVDGAEAIREALDCPMSSPDFNQDNWTSGHDGVHMSYSIYYGKDLFSGATRMDETWSNPSYWSEVDRGPFSVLASDTGQRSGYGCKNDICRSNGICHGEFHTTHPTKPNFDGPIEEHGRTANNLWFGWALRPWQQTTGNYLYTDGRVLTFEFDYYIPYTTTPNPETHDLMWLRSNRTVLVPFPDGLDPQTF